MRNENSKRKDNRSKETLSGEDEPELENYYNYESPILDSQFYDQNTKI